jgi:iron(III) transport system permease protein
VVFPIIAYIAARTAYWGRGALDFLTWLPSAIPGIVIGLGFLWFFLETPLFTPLYGTIWVLIAAVSLESMTVSVQIIKSNLLQFGNELEEASRAHGGSWFYTFRRIMLPLSAPALAAIAALAFGSAARDVSVVALLTTRSIEPLSIFQLLFVSNGYLEQASVIGVIVTLLTLAVTIAARFLRRGFAAATD